MFNNEFLVIMLGWVGGRGVRYAKSLSLQYSIDIDILQNSLIDINIFKTVVIDIDIFKTVLIDIDIFKTVLREGVKKKTVNKWSG